MLYYALRKRLVCIGIVNEILLELFWLSGIVFFLFLLVSLGTEP